MITKFFITLVFGRRRTQSDVLFHDRPCGAVNSDLSGPFDKLE